MKIFIIFISIIVFYATAIAQNGVIKGRLFDATNNEPLPFGTVVVTGTTIGVTADENGNFVLSGLKPGYVSLTASFIGYETTVSRDIFVSNAKPSYVEIVLQQSNKQLDEVVVKIKPFTKTEESPLSLKTISLVEIESSPGSNRDISKVIQSYPGVGSTPSFRNDVIIRGGGPSESRFFLDGVEIPNLNHFATQGASGGPVGIVNADLISGVNFYSGAFPANRGNALSGVFEFSQINGNKDRLKYKASIGASELSLTFDGPVTDNSDFIFSFRRSYLQFLFSALGLPFLPTFNDYQLKYHYRKDNSNEFTLISIGAYDVNTLNTKIKNPTPEQEYILTYLPVNNQWTYTIGGVYKHYNKKSNHTLVLSRNMLNNENYKYPENDESKPKILDYTSQEIENKLRYEITSRINNFKFIYGVATENASYSNNTNQQLYSSGTIKTITYDSKLNLQKYGAFLQASSKWIDDRLTLSLGARVDGNTFSKSMKNPLNQFSPRLSASYQLSEKISINANAGRYFQMPAYTTLGYRDSSGILKNKENNLKYIAVNHLITGLEYRLTDGVLFTLEGFYKQYSRYPFSIRDSLSIATKGADFGVIGDEEVLSIGEGRALGAELMNRIKLEKFTSTVALTLVRSEFLSKGTYIPTLWDSKYILTNTASLQLKKDWTIGLKWRFVGGLPYTPYDLNLSSIKTVWDVNGKPISDMQNVNKERFKSFHQLDVRIDKRYFFNKWSLMMYLDVQNVYNFKSQSTDIIIREKDESGNFILTDNNTRYQLRKYPNSSGTVLPTIGIMIEF